MSEYIPAYVNETWSNAEAKKQARELRETGQYDRVLVRGNEVLAYVKKA